MSLVEMSLTVLLICSRKINKMIDSIERAYIYCYKSQSVIYVILLIAFLFLLASNLAFS